MFATIHPHPGPLPGREREWLIGAASRRRTAVAQPGKPFRTLAEELLAYLLVEEGKTDEAIAAMTTLMQDQEASSALRARLGQMVTALGGTPPQDSAG